MTTSCRESERTREQESERQRLKGCFRFAFALGLWKLDGEGRNKWETLRDSEPLAADKRATSALKRCGTRSS
jgi:hypothetical protein